MEIGAFGTFGDPAVERAFEQDHFALSVRRSTRVSVPLSIAAFLAFGIHDLLVIPAAHRAAWLVRYGFFGPIGLLVVAFVLTNRRWERHQPAMLVLGLSINTAVVWIATLSDLGGYLVYTSQAIVFLTLGPLIARLNVRTQALYTALSVLVYLAFDLAAGHAPHTVRFSIIVTLLTLGVIGTLTARQVGVQARTAYLQRQVIKAQMEAIEAERSRSERLLLNVLPRPIASRLRRDPGATIAEAFDDATVLFSDIVGFTELSARLTPEELVRRLDEVFSRFDDIADDLGLEKIKTIGDAYMVAGGIPARRDGHAAAVCEMALRMRDAVTEMAARDHEPIDVRIGVHSGPVVAGVIGKRKFIYDVWGDTVNTASRMESHGIPGAVQVSERVFEATRHVFAYEPRGAIAVKGKGEMKTYVLTGRVPDAIAPASALATAPVPALLDEAVPTVDVAEPAIDRVFGTFVDPDLEREHQRDSFALGVRSFTRFGVTLAVVAFLSYGIHDRWVVPEVHEAAWVIRYGFFAPIGLLMVAFAFVNDRVERHQPAMLIFGMAVNVAVLWIGAISPPVGFYIYTSFAIIFLTLGPLIARMSVRTQIAYTLLTTAAYLALDVGLAHAAVTARVSHVLDLLTLGAIGALAARQNEIHARSAFHKRRVIRAQIAALDAERARSESLLLNVLPRPIAERLKDAPDVTIADLHPATTVLFSDIVGFTELSQRLAPDELVKRLDEVFSGFDEIADGFGLEKIKTIGDAYMVAGGVPEAREDHAEAMCEMALRMRDLVRDLAARSEAPISVRIGIHTGPVVGGVIGKKKFIYDVWGDTVNIASRMESHGLPGAIQVSETTYDAVKARFTLEPRGPIQVKGKGEMHAYLLVGRQGEGG